jgi:hypothetical protein
VFDEIGQGLQAHTSAGPMPSAPEAAPLPAPEPQPAEPAVAKPPRQRRKPTVEGDATPKPARPRKPRTGTVS